MRFIQNGNAGPHGVTGAGAEPEAETKSARRGRRLGHMPHNGVKSSQKQRKKQKQRQRQPQAADSQ